MKTLLSFLLLSVVHLAHAQAADVTADAKLGTPVTFVCDVASGTQPFTYQWHKNGTFIAGATAATYTIPSADVSSAGTYFVQVRNAYGTTISNNGVLSVTLVGTGPGVTTIRITFTPAK